MCPRLIRLAAVAMTFAAAGCAAMNAGSYSDRGIDFAQYRTFDWGPADALPTGDPRLDRNPLFQDYVQGAIERRLAVKGYGRSSDTPPDLLIHYHASVTRRIDIDRLGRGYDTCYGETCPIRVTEFDAGTLVLDIVDARTGRVIWRGWARHAVADILNNPDRMAQRVDEAAERMLQTLPAGHRVTSAMPPMQSGGKE